MTQVFEQKTRARDKLRLHYAIINVPSTTKWRVPPKDVYLPISKLHSILAIANLLAHNNLSLLCAMAQLNTFEGTIYFALGGTINEVANGIEPNPYNISSLLRKKCLQVYQIWHHYGRHQRKESSDLMRLTARRLRIQNWRINPTVTESIQIEIKLLVQLYFKGCPLPLAPLFRQCTNCKLTSLT